MPKFPKASLLPSIERTKISALQTPWCIAKGEHSQNSIVVAGVEPLRLKASPALESHGNKIKCGLAPYISELRLTVALRPLLCLQEQGNQQKGVYEHRWELAPGSLQEGTVIFTDNIQAQEKGLGNINWFTRGAKLMLDRWHQLEGKIQQQEPYASKTTECMPQSLNSFLCFTDHFKIGLLL